jgi:hypothetical protein
MVRSSSLLSRRATRGKRNLFTAHLQVKSKNQYWKSLLLFIEWLVEHEHAFTLEPAVFDALAVQYIQFLFDGGHPQYLAWNFASAIQCYVPSLRKQLPQSWRMLSGWKSLEPASQAIPLSQGVALLVSFCLYVQGLEQSALVVWILWHTWMRPSEPLRLRCKDVRFQVDAQGLLQLPVVLVLWWTKTTTRHGGPETVLIHDAVLARVLVAHVSKRLAFGMGPSPVFSITVVALRNQFKSMLHLMGLYDAALNLYSLRRGGATNAFSKGTSIEQILIIGRWQNLKTARGYISQGVALVAAFDLPDHVSSLASLSHSMLHEWHA